MSKNKIDELNNDNKVIGQSSLYMTVWFTITFMVVLAMTVQFVGIRTVIIESELSSEPIKMEAVTKYIEAIPYEPLIYALISYMLGLFGLEGTRAVIKSFDVSGLKKEAENMPNYKRKRLIIMLFTFVGLAFLSMIYQFFGSKVSADYHLSTIFFGIAFGSSLVAYSDFAPKLSTELSNKIEEKREKEEEKD